MAGPNTTGLPKTEDYNLGRGIVYFASIDSVTGRPISWRDLGNSPDFKLAIATDTLEHKSSRQGLKIVDKEVTISQTLSVTLSLDELNHENLALVFAGAKAAYTNPAIAGFANYVMVADGNLALGRWYDIVTSGGARAYDVDATKLTVTTNETTPVSLVKDVDYTLDGELGRIFTISSSTKLATAITAVKGLKVTLTADATAYTVNEVRTLTTTSVTGALKFIGSNPADNDRKTEYEFHKISLKANGDLNLISDDFTKLELTGKAEAAAGVDANSPTLTIRNVVTP